MYGYNKKSSNFNMYESVENMYDERYTTYIAWYEIWNQLKGFS